MDSYNQGNRTKELFKFFIRLIGGSFDIKQNGEKYIYSDGVARYAIWYDDSKDDIILDLVNGDLSTRILPEPYYDIVEDVTERATSYKDMMEWLRANIETFNYKYK